MNSLVNVLFYVFIYRNRYQLWAHITNTYCQNNKITKHFLERMQIKGFLYPFPKLIKQDRDFFFILILDNCIYSPSSYRNVNLTNNIQKRKLISLIERDNFVILHFHIYISLILIWCGSSIYPGTEACNFFFSTCEGILNMSAWQIEELQVVQSKKNLNYGKTPSYVLQGDYIHICFIVFNLHIFCLSLNQMLDLNNFT